MRRGNKYGARKTQCQFGHTHDSKREAERCSYLQIMQKAGEITDLRIQAAYPFIINGKPLKMSNGHTAKITVDFEYKENGKTIAEDSKGFIVRDFPLRWALAKALYPHVEFKLS